MKRATYFLVIAAMLAILPGAALGQSGITWDTEIFIQNIGTETAYVRVYYYLNIADGGGAHPTVPYEDKEVPAGQSIRFYPGVPSPFNGSAVVESTQPVVVIVDEIGDDPDYNAAYEGFEMGSDTVRLPVIMTCNSGYYTFFNVQNAGSEATTATVTYLPWPGSPAKNQATCDLDPGEACTITQEPGSSTDWPACGSTWLGGAKVESDNNQHLVATVNQLNTDPLLGMGTYSGFTGAGSERAIALGIMTDNADFWSAIGVTNAGDADTDITFKFYPNPGSAAIADITHEDIPADASTAILMPAVYPSGTWIGTVEVVGVTENIFVMTNVLRATAQAQLSSYKGADPDPLKATDTLYLPAVLSDDATHGWWTAAQIFNTGVDTTTVTVTYSTCPASYCGSDFTPSARAIEIPPWDSRIDFHTTGDFAGNYYFGNAVVTSDGPGILAIANMLDAFEVDNGDVTNSYNATNK